MTCSMGTDLLQLSGFFTRAYRISSIRRCPRTRSRRRSASTSSLQRTLTFLPLVESLHTRLRYGQRRLHGAESL